MYFIKYKFLKIREKYYMYDIYKFLYIYVNMYLIIMKE